MATDMSLEAQEALASVKRASLVKKMNEESWSDHMEFLLKSWGEKAAGLRFIHNASAGKWKKFSNQLTLTGIAISSISSAVSLVAASIDDDR
jgi:hypothetical protein